MKAHYKSLCLFVLTLGLAFSAAARQSAPIEWKLEETVTAADRKDILQLAKEMGIDAPREVISVHGLPGDCRWVSVESAIVESGNQRTWYYVEIRPPGSRCLIVPTGVKKVGRWTALRPELGKYEEWRIRDKEWHIDIHLGAGVPFNDAELIVLAIRRGELKNRLSQPTCELNSNSSLKQINADRISRIEKGWQGERSYKVTTGYAGGFILSVEISDSGVELSSCVPWLV
jgi:hypothetical protein